MLKISMQHRIRTVLRLLLAALLTALTLRTVSAAATARDLRDAAERLRSEAELPLALLRFEMGSEQPEDSLSPGAALALSLAPILGDAKKEITAAWSSELQLPPDDSVPVPEDQEGTILSPPKPHEEFPRGADNGVPSRTLRPGDPSGYTVLGNVYINNGSACSLNTADLAGEPAAKCPDDGPQVLIVHTHGTEAYTMPAGEEYIPSDEYRTLDEEKNMLRIGDEIARVLTEAGLEVLHDRTLHDYPNYSGAYNRSLASIEQYRAQYPSLIYILDVHRDAVEDSEGNPYKLLCAEESGAAQIEFVIGSSGGGLDHPHWRENLKLACAVQETLYADHPTLMRPVILRNSRYNQQVTPGSLLVEVGTAGNSLDEALTAARLFAQGFAETVLDKR